MEILGWRDCEGEPCFRRIAMCLLDAMAHDMVTFFSRIIFVSSRDYFNRIFAIIPSQRTDGHRHKRPLLAIQFGAAARCELPKCERTCRVAALTRNLHIFASRITTGISAVFFSIRYLAQAWYVRAFLASLICHFDSFLSSSLLNS